MPKSRSLAAMTRDALTITALLTAAAGSAAGAQRAGTFAEFLEVYATAEDRSAALATLVPGTETHDYFSALHAQSQGNLDQVDRILAAWLDRAQGKSELYLQIEARQALLRASTDPAATYRFLERELGLRYEHRRRVPGEVPDLPTALDAARIDTDRLLQSRLDRDRTDAFNDLDVRLLERLVGRQLTERQREGLLDRLPRADVPGLMAVIFADFAANPRLSFGGRNIHERLTLEQLDQLRTARPVVVSNASYVNAVLRRLAPTADDDVADPATRRAYLERIWAFVGPLPGAFDSLKAHVLYHTLRLDLAEERVNAELFERYLRLPRNAHYIPAPRRTPRNVIDLSQSYEGVTALAAIGDETPLVEGVLALLLRDAADYRAYLDVLEESFVKRVFARTKLMYGDPANADAFARMLDDPRQVEELRERVDLEFVNGVERVFGADEEVALELDVKNVETLIVKVFEIDPVAVFDRFGHLFVSGLDLDGLVPTAETTIEYDQPPIRRHRETIPLPACAGPGIYVAEFIGGGLSSRAVLHKGSLHMLVRTGAAGQAVRVLDGDRRPVDDAVLRFGGRDFLPRETGEIMVPFSTKPGRKSVLLRRGDVATVASFEHEGEAYALDAPTHITAEALIAGAEATFVTRPRLTVNGERIPLELLKDPRLVITSTDKSGDSATKIVTDLALTAPDELTATIRVPERASSFSVQLHGEIRSLSEAVDVELHSSASSFTVATIAPGSATQSLFVASVDGYRIEVRGRNGEVEPDVQVTVQFEHALVEEQIVASLKTDADGRIALGELKDVERVLITGPGHLRGQWDIARADHYGMHERVNARVGQVIQIPYTGPRNGPDRAAFSLIELRAGAPFRDAFGAIGVANRYVTLRGLTAGAYELVLKETEESYRIDVVAGDLIGGYYVGARRALEASDPKPLQIQGVERGDAEIVVSLGGWSERTRVHVVATRFYDPYDPAQDLALDPASGLASSSFDDPRSSFQSGRELSDEYRYVLDRRRSPAFVGNMLQRPGVLLNPWAVDDTSDSMLDQGREGGNYKDGVGGGGGSARGGRTAGRARREQGRSGIPRDQQLLDFLAEPSATILNLVPDGNGQVTIPAAALGSKQGVRIVAVDERFTAAVDLTAKAQAPALRDRRLEDALDPSVPMLQRRRIVLAQAGEALRVRDGLSASTKTYDTLSSVFEYFRASGGEEFAKFEFMTRWPSLSAEEKREKYSEFVCHELNAFLRERDPEFFEVVVRPYMANKSHRTFIDDWLLGEDLAGYLDPWRFERLNVVEQILLVRALEGDAAQLADDLMATVPEGAFSLESMFGQVLATSGLEADTMTRELKRRAQSISPAAPGAPAPSAGRMFAADEPAVLGKLSERSAANEESRFGLGLELEVAEEMEDAQSIRDHRGPGDVVPGFFFRDLDPTREYAETHYWRTRLQAATGDLITISPFWADFARAGGGPFVSTAFPLANRNRTEMLLALAFLDLPFEAAEHQIEVDGRAVTMTAGSPLLVALEDLVAPDEVDQDSTLLVGQDFFRVDQRMEIQDGVQREKYVSGEFLTGVPYGCRIVLTNPSSQTVQLNALLQIPRGSIPLGDTRVTNGVPVAIGPYGTQALETTFYFPEPGTFADFPVHVGRGDTLVGAADAATLEVVDELSVQDTSTWEWISQNAELERVLEYLEANNPRTLDLGLIAWRMGDPRAFDAITARLERRNVFDATLWQYAIKHQKPRAARAYLSQNPRIRPRVGYAFASPLLDVIPERTGAYEHLAYEPLVNGRILPFGDQSRIQNDEFKRQYQRFLLKIALQREVTPADELELCYYLLLQDRVIEAQERFAGVERDSVVSDLQYDYMRAYLGFSRGETSEAGEIARAYADHPVDRWRNRFRTVLAQIDEIEGRGGSDVIDPDDRDQSQGALAGREPVLGVEIDGSAIHIAYERVEEVELRFHAMDIEFLFSASPFVQGDRGSFGLVQPNRLETIPLDPTKSQTTVMMPEEFARANVLVEVRGAGLARRDSYFAGSVQVQGLERYGQVRVVDEETKAPLPKTYVKVYAQLSDGSVRFHKDGYTDLRGRFDYVSLSGVQGPPVTRYAVLAMNAESGATVTEMLPPAR